MTIALADEEVASGTRVDRRYRLDGLLAREHGSSVWRGTDVRLKRPVAVQVFEPERSRTDEVFDAVRRVSGLTHAGVAQVFDANEDASPPYLVREWIGGRDLRSLLIAGGPLEPWFVAETFQQASAALAAAHDAGVFHLRLSPRSIMWGPTGRVKIVGLGIEAALADACVDDPRLADTRAVAALLCGALSGRWPGGPGGLGAVRVPPGRRLRAWRTRRRGLGRELTAIARRAVADDDRQAGGLRRLTVELEEVVRSDAPAPLRAYGRSGPAPALVRATAPEYATSTRPIPVVRPIPDHCRVAA